MPRNAAPAPPKRPDTAPQRSRPGPALAEAHKPARLPIAVRPLPDEPAPSWATRFAARYAVPVRQLLAEVLGIRVDAWNAEHFTHVLEPHHDLIRDAMNIRDPARLFAPSDPTRDLARCLDTYLSEYHPRAWRGHPGSRFCPACLAEHDGAWRLEWQQPLVMVCRDHNLLLVNSCPRCGGMPWSSPAWLGGADPGWICAHTRDRRTRPDTRQVAARCGFDLRTVEAVPAGPADVKIQGVIGKLTSAVGKADKIAATNPAADPPPFPAFGQQFRPVDVFTALLELADAAPPAGAAAPYRIRSDPAILLDGLHEAIQVIGEHDTATAAERSANLLRRDGVYGQTSAVHRLRRRKHNPLLGYLALTAMAPTPSPTLQLTYRVANPIPRTRQAA